MRQYLGVVQTDPADLVTVSMMVAYAANSSNLSWCPEIICTSNGTAVATGYNDVPGGITVEPGPYGNGVLIDSVYVRLGNIGSTITGGSLGIDVYLGSGTAQGTDIASGSLAVGANNGTLTLNPSVAAAGNSVVRIYLTAGNCTNTDPIHVQLRGRYA